MRKVLIACGVFLAGAVWLVAQSPTVPVEWIAGLDASRTATCNSGQGYQALDTAKLYGCSNGGWISTGGSSSAGIGGTIVYTSSQTASTADSGKLVIMNCSSACGYTLSNPVPSTSWYTCVRSVGSTNATLTWPTGTTVSGIAFSTLVGGTPTLTADNQTPCFYADSTVNTAYYLVAGNSGFANYGAQTFGNADVSIGSSDTEIFGTTTNLQVPWASSPHEGGAFNHDMCARFTVELNYTGATAGTVLFKVSLWGNTATNPTLVVPVAIPASMGSQAFSITGACSFKAAYAPGLTNAAANVYASTSLTGVVAKWKDTTVTTAFGSWLDATIE